MRPCCRVRRWFCLTIGHTGPMKGKRWCKYLGAWAQLLREPSAEEQIPPVMEKLQQISSQFRPSLQSWPPCSDLQEKPCKKNPNTTGGKKHTELVLIEAKQLWFSKKSLVDTWFSPLPEGEGEAGLLPLHPMLCYLGVSCEGSLFPAAFSRTEQPKEMFCPQHPQSGHI